MVLEEKLEEEEEKPRCEKGGIKKEPPRPWLRLLRRPPLPPLSVGGTVFLSAPPPPPSSSSSSCSLPSGSDSQSVSVEDCGCQRRRRMMMMMMKNE